MPNQTRSYLAVLFLLFALFSSHSALATSQAKNQQLQAGQTPDGISQQEWAGVQQQIKMSKYQALEQDDGSYAAANITNGWHINYGSDGRTMLTPYNPGDSTYFIGLQLKSLGYTSQIEFNRPQKITSDETILTYQWNDNVGEVWINSSNRLEQWFEIQQRPHAVKQDQPLSLQMALTTDLQVAQNGNALSFANNISYDKLKVWDSTGAGMPARMHLQNDTLSLVIDDSLAQYPLIIDPGFQQQAYLKASNTGRDDSFGRSIAISGDTLVVGAPDENSSTTGVNGIEWDNSANDAGAVYVFIRQAGTWIQQAYLKASNTETYNRFGSSVGITGDTLVVGAVGENSNATGVDGDQNDNTAINSGAVYVFTRTDGVWSQQAYLKASNTDVNDHFGVSVAISGETLVVGALDESSNATGVDGDESDNSISMSGAAYVFIRTAGAWSQQAYLKASNPGVNDWFGRSVAISGDTLVVGADHEDSNATEIDGSGDNDLAKDSGAAYVFNRTDTAWSQQAYLKASNSKAGIAFGTSVSISGDTLVVGAYKEGSSGAAYVFTRTDTSWNQQAYLKASNSGINYSFGRSVAISGDMLVVGANYEASNATGVDGDETDDSAFGAGAAYFFTRDAAVWSQRSYLKASNTEAGDWFGWSVAISEGMLVVGAPDEDSTAMGINGTEDYDQIYSRDSGAVYTFFYLIFTDSFEDAL